MNWSIKQTNENNEKSSNYGFLEKEANKENIKTFAIIILAVLLIISIFTGHTQKNDDSQNQISELKSKLEDTTNKMADKQKEIIDLQNFNKILQDEKTKLESEKQELNSKIEELQNVSSAKTISNIISNDTAKINSSTDYDTSSHDSSNLSTITNSDNTTEMVWIGDTGTKYHKQSCRTLKGNGHQITMKQALAEGRQACKACIK